MVLMNFEKLVDDPFNADTYQSTNAHDKVFIGRDMFDDFFVCVPSKGIDEIGFATKKDAIAFAEQNVTFSSSHFTSLGVDYVDEQRLGLVSY